MRPAGAAEGALSDPVGPPRLGVAGVFLVLIAVLVPFGPRIAAGVGNVYTGTLAALCWVAVWTLFVFAGPLGGFSARSGAQKAVSLYLLLLVFQVFLHLDRFMEEPGALLRTLQLGGYLALFITIASLRLDPRVAVAVARVSIILLPIECVMAWRNRALESYGFLCGTFDGEHNTFAAYLVLMVAMVTAYLQVAARRAVRLALVLLLILAGVSLAFSFSRAAYLAAPVAVLAVFHGSGGRRALLRGVAVIAAALAFAAMFAPADLADRFLSIWDALRSQRADISFGTRLAIWRAAVDDLVRTRFLGVGIIGENIIDNSFVRALVETGFVGLGVHLWLVFSAAAWLRRASRRTPVPEIRAIALGLYGATIALLIVMSLSCDTFLLHRVMGLFWTMFGAVVASSPASAGSSHHDPPPDSPHAAVA